MPIRLATAYDRETIRVIKPVGFYDGQLGAEIADAPEPQVGIETPPYNPTRQTWMPVPTRKFLTDGKCAEDIKVCPHGRTVYRTGKNCTFPPCPPIEDGITCDCMPGYYSPGGDCTPCIKFSPTPTTPVTPTTPTDDDDKIFGFPRWVVFGGGIAAGLFFLSQMGEVK